MQGSREDRITRCPLGRETPKWEVEDKKEAKGQDDPNRKVTSLPGC